MNREACGQPLVVKVIRLVPAFERSGATAMGWNAERLLTCAGSCKAVMKPLSTRMTAHDGGLFAIASPPGSLPRPPETNVKIGYVARGSLVKRRS